MGRTGNIVFGLLLIAVGVILALNGILDWDLDLGDLIGVLWPLALIAVGVWLLILNRRRSTGGRSYARLFGDLNIDVRDRDPDGLHVDMVFGDVHLDLTRSPYADKNHRVDLQSVFGDMRIIVPREMAVRAHGGNVIGDIELFDRTKKGFGNSVDVESPDYQTTQRKLTLSMQAVIGDIRVTRSES